MEPYAPAAPLIVIFAFDFDCTKIAQVDGTVPSTRSAVRLVIVGLTDEGTDNVKVQVFEPTSVVPL